MSAYSGATIIWLNTNDDGRYKIESNVITQSNLVFSIDTGISASYAGANNTWTHVAITYTLSSKSLSFYYNGQLSSTLTHLGTEVAPGAGSRVNLNIGCLRNATAGSFFKGYMGPVQLYNRTLTQSEIIKNFNATRNRFGV